MKLRVVASVAENPFPLTPAQVAETTTEEGDQKKFSRYTYPAMRKTQGSFSLDIEAGEFTDRCGAAVAGKRLQCCL